LKGHNLQAPSRALVASFLAQRVVARTVALCIAIGRGGVGCRDRCVSFPP
jgi:hypothetical protein